MGDEYGGRFLPGTMGCHEALVAVGIAENLIDAEIAQHPAIVRRPDWLALAEEAAATLAALYQAIGVEHLGGGK